jgi:hypothetical protein
LPLALALILYLPTVGYDFVNYDDPQSFLYNPFFTPLGFGKAASLWVKPYMSLYAPLTYSIWAMVLAMAGPSAGWLHAVNVLVFASGVVAVYRVISELFVSREARLWGTALWAAHPLQVEAVCWATALKTTLSVTLSLWAMVYYLRDRRAPALALFVLACLAKSTGVVVPLVLLVLDWGARKVSPRQALRRLGPWLAVSLVFFGVATAVYRGGKAVEPLSVGQRLVVASASWGFYVGKALVPWPLSIDYGGEPRQLLASPWSYLALVGILLGAAFLAYRRPRWPLVLIAVFTLPLLPFLGLVPHDLQAVTLAQDRYASLSLLALALGVAAWLDSGRGESATTWVAGAVGLCLLLSVEQRAVWRNSETLWTHVLEINPRSSLAEFNLAQFYADTGRLDEAEAHFHASYALEPDPATLKGLERVEAMRRK